jgi:hypothetical protein
LRAGNLETELRMAQFKKPQDNETYAWTGHAADKMLQYGLSADRLKRVIRFPTRTEESVVEGTIACMQPSSVKTVNGKKTWSQEIWVMYKLVDGQQAIFNSQFPISKQQRKGDFDSLKQSIEGKGIRKKLKIITAWRYPGISPKRDPVPQEIIDEARAALF